MGKRGISPLIATVLIIGFTVALAAIIITWGGRFIQDTTKGVSEQTEISLACANLDAEIRGVQCDATDKLTQITLASNSETNIIRTIFRATSTNDEVTVNDTGEGVVGFGSINSNVSGSLTLTDQPKTVEAIPVIEINGLEETCSAAIITYRVSSDHACRT